jgi:branched-chain amino acid transport system permease protein
MSSARSSRLSADRIAGGIFVALAVFAPLIFSEYWVATLLTQMLFLGIVAASLIFLSAYGGMVSLAQVSIYGVAGFALGNLTTNGNTKGLNLGWAEAPGIVVALIIAVVVAFVFGALASRSFGIYFLMITLVFSVIANLFFGQVTSVSGFGGISGIPIPEFLSRTAHPDRLYFVTLAVALLVYALLRYVARTPFGLVLQGIRDDPVRMSSLGYNVTLHRTLAFAFAGFIAAIGGVLFVWWNAQIAPSTIGLSATIDVLVIAVVGGLLAGCARLRAHQQLRTGHRPGLRAFPHADRGHLPGHRACIAQRPHRAVGARHGGAAAAAADGHHPGEGVGRAHTGWLSGIRF